MSPLREAAQQALEALENCTSEHGHRCSRCDSEVDEGGRVVTALREALAQQGRESVSATYHPCTYILIEYIKQTSGGVEVLAKWDAARRLVDLGFNKHTPKAQPVQEPRREWQGLTDEIIDSVWHSPEGTNSIRAVAYAIEAHLKEKNA